MFVNQIRAGITAAGATPLSYAPVDALRELVTAYGGTPTQYSYVGLLREAVTAKGGTPTQFSIMGLLRELLIAGGLSPTSMDPSVLWGQLASIASTPSAPANIIDPAAWGNPSAGTVSADGSGTVTFASAANGTNISDTPLIALKPSTTYDVSVTRSVGAGSVQIRYGAAGGTVVLWSAGATSVIPVGATSTTQFTTGASDLGDGKIYYRASAPNTSATLSGLSISEH